VWATGKAGARSFSKTVSGEKANAGKRAWRSKNDGLCGGGHTDDDMWGEEKRKGETTVVGQARATNCPHGA